MSEAITIADIYKLFERTEAQFAEFQKEAERRHVEAERRNAEAERRNVEAERRNAEAEQRNAEADRRSAEAGRRRAEADRTMEELKKQVRATTEAVNNLTTRWGRFVEEMVEPAVVQLFQER
ncbi:MAG: DUF3782 domain-containing protein, partial [Microcystis aeruginosa]